MATPSPRRSWSRASRWPLRPAAPTTSPGRAAATLMPLSRWQRRPRRRRCLLRQQVLRPRYRVLMPLSRSRRRRPKTRRKSGRAAAPEKPRRTRWRSPNGRRGPGRGLHATMYCVHRGRSSLRAVPLAGCAELGRAASARQRRRSHLEFVDGVSALAACQNLRWF